jgi:hypothetical protein
MKHFFDSAFFAVETSSGPEQLPEQSPAKRGSRKKFYVALGSTVTVLILLFAFMLAPQGSANVIPLDVEYSVGEKLTYDLNVKLTLGLGNASSVNEADLGLTIEILALDGDTYTVNYTIIVPRDNPNINLTDPNATSRVLQLQKSEMVTLIALLPIVLQADADNQNATPLLTGVFDKSEARVGDTWQVPLNSQGSSSNTFETLTVEFLGIEDVSVAAGTFRVFGVNLSSSYQGTQNGASVTAELTVQTHLEYETCKQIQSNLQLTMTSQTSGITYSVGAEITTTLTHDQKL